MNSQHIVSFKKHTIPGKRRFLLPAVYLLISFLLMLLPLQRVVSSLKIVLSYTFLPQVRMAHGVVQYAQGVSDTVGELLRAHQENEQLKQEIETTHLMATQAQDIFAENERLSQLLALEPNKPWQGVWARVAYREPTQWNSVVLDKGAADGIEVRSAVIALDERQEGLAGVVIEVTENTSKVLLVRDEDFSAAVRLEQGGEEGLLQGAGNRPAHIQYVPLLAQVKPGDKVYTSASSRVFPAGILVGEVTRVLGQDTFQTSLLVEVAPQIRSEAVREVFVISKPHAEK